MPLTVSDNEAAAIRSVMRKIQDEAMKIADEDHDLDYITLALSIEEAVVVCSMCETTLDERAAIATYRPRHPAYAPEHVNDDS
jgi:hypothetical protein